MPNVLTGLDGLVEMQFSALRGARIGILANQATVDRNLRHAVDLIHERGSSKVLRLFAPEHGFRGELQDMASVGDSVDPYTKLPVISLYGSTEESLTPRAEHFADLDALVVDLPDIGARYYTFAQSLCYAMKTAQQTGTKVIVLDRPNPIGGALFEGALLMKECRSFCGYAPVPNRHGMTLGELALLMKNGFGTGENAIPPCSCELEVIPAQGWKREMYIDETGLPWVIPSPNMPTVDTALVYPGTCLFEATTLSEGRGTTRPFETLGAPGIDGVRWAKAALEQGIPLDGAVLRPLTFMPKFSKHANQICGGVQLHVLNSKTFQPFRWSLALIASAAKIFPAQFAWRDAEYEFVKDVPAIDLLYGSSRFRELVGSRGNLSEIAGELESNEHWFGKARKEFLLY